MLQPLVLKLALVLLVLPSSASASIPCSDEPPPAWQFWRPQLPPCEPQPDLFALVPWRLLVALLIGSVMYRVYCPTMRALPPLLLEGEAQNARVHPRERRRRRRLVRVRQRLRVGSRV